MTFDGEDEIKLYMNGSEEDNHQFSETNWMSGLDTVRLGTAPDFEDPGGKAENSLEGFANNYLIVQEEFSGSEISDLYSASEGGQAVSPDVISSGEAYELEVSASIPDETSIEVEVKQDTSGDSSPDNSESIALDDDTETYQLNNFEESTNSDYWLEIQLETDDKSVSPSLQSIELKTLEDG